MARSTPGGRSQLVVATPRDCKVSIGPRGDDRMLPANPMLSDGESDTAPIMAPGDLVGAASAERRLEQWFGIAAAALLHLTILLWLTLDWRLSIPPPEPEAVSVRLVQPPEPEPTP